MQLTYFRNFAHSIRPKSEIRAFSPNTTDLLVTDFCVLSHVAIYINWNTAKGKWWQLEAVTSFH